MEYKISVMFDMDGLMFDTERLGIRSWRYAGRCMGIDIDESIILETIGLDIEKTEMVYRKHLGENIPFNQMMEIRIRYAEDGIKRNGVPVKEGLMDLLDLLDNKGVPKSVATSTERSRAVELLYLAGIVDRFDAVVCGDDIARGKPNPDIFLKAVQRLGTKPENCVVFEDSEYGIRAAAAAGMIPIIIPDIRCPSQEVMALAHRSFTSLARACRWLECRLQGM